MSSQLQPHSRCPNPLPLPKTKFSNTTWSCCKEPLGSLAIPFNSQVTHQGPDAGRSTKCVLSSRKTQNPNTRLSLPPFFYHSVSETLLELTHYGNGSVGKVFATQSRGLELGSPAPKQTPGVVVWAMIPKLGRQRQEDLWGFLAS